MNFASFLLSMVIFLKSGLTAPMEEMDIMVVPGRQERLIIKLITIGQIHIRLSESCNHRLLCSVMQDQMSGGSVMKAGWVA